MSFDTPETRRTELATKWALRLEGPELTEGERAALQHWLLDDSANADALGEACYIISAVGVLSAEKRAEILALPEELSEDTSTDHAPQVAPAARYQPQWRAYALAASMIFATVLGTVWFAVANPGWLPRTYRTATAEVRVVQLPDGSMAHLNAKTTARWVGFSRERRMELVAGQALFEVAHGPAHPFYVRAGSGLVRVLGTKFDLNRRNESTVLTVLEGAVEVRNSEERVDGRWHRIVYANQRLTFGPAELIDDVRQVDASRAVQWREFTLDLDREPLSAVIEELTRYTDQAILLSDDRLTAHRISGTLQVRDIREAVRDLEMIAPVAVRQSGTALVLDLRTSNPPEAQ
jgi:transmembrane sensor